MIRIIKPGRVCNNNTLLTGIEAYNTAITNINNLIAEDMKTLQDLENPSVKQDIIDNWAFDTTKLEFVRNIGGE